jgi:hypothetical protein
MYKIPKCCGKKMSVNLETRRFIELWCETCDDIVYVKKDDVGLQVIED